MKQQTAILCKMIACTVMLIGIVFVSIGVYRVMQKPQVQTPVLQESDASGESTVLDGTNGEFPSEEIGTGVDATEGTMTRGEEPNPNAASNEEDKAKDETGGDSAHEVVDEE